MAGNLHKNHDKFFQTLSLLLVSLVVVIILTLSYYIINATTSTNSRASGPNCLKYTTKSKCVSNGCSWNGSYCSSNNNSVPTQQQQNNQALINNIPSGTVDCGSYTTSKKCYAYGQNQCTWNGFSCVHSFSSKSQLVNAYLTKYNLSLCNSLLRTSGPDGKCLSGLECNGGIVPYEGNSFGCTNPYVATITLNCCPKDCVLDAIPGAGVNVCLTRYR